MTAPVDDWHPFVDKVDEVIRTYFAHLNIDPMASYTAARFILDGVLDLPLEVRMGSMGIRLVEGPTSPYNYAVVKVER